MSIVSIPVEDIRKILPFIGQQDIRYYLNGFCVEPYHDGCLLIATNGHVMGVIESKAARCDRVRIINASDPDFVAALNGIERQWESAYAEDNEDNEDIESVGRRNGTNETLVIDSADGRAVITDKDGTELYVLPGKPFHDGRFPEWRKVLTPVENLEPGLQDAISAHYLAHLRHLFDGIRNKPQVVFYHSKTEQNKASIARFDSIPELVVLIMPMRRDHAISGWPDWMQQKVEAP